MEKEALAIYYESIKDTLDKVRKNYTRYHPQDYSIDKLINMDQLEEILDILDDMFRDVRIDYCEFFKTLKSLGLEDGNITAFDTVSQKPLVIEFDKRKLFIKDNTYEFIRDINKNTGRYMCTTRVPCTNIVLHIDYVNDVPILYFNGEDIQAIWTPAFEKT